VSSQSTDDPGRENQLALEALL